MKEWFCIIVMILLGIILILSIKLILVKKSADEIRSAFADRITTDTNTLIDISSHDRKMRLLATAINVQLRQLREERQRYLHGDTELKEAVTNIAHDLRTPLTAIIGYLQLLEREDEPESVRYYLNLISNRAEALSALTEELFRYSCITSQQDLKLETVVLNDVLEESLAGAYDAFMKRGIVPEIVLPERRVERNLDRSALCRVFENIIANAVKYSDGDFGVRMSGDGKITFSNTSAKLTQVEAGRLFDRFYTVENCRKSTGLGLSIAKLLTERMGGTIKAVYTMQTLSIEVFFKEPMF